MNRSFKALALALLLHALIVVIVILMLSYLPQESKVVEKERRVKVSLKDMPKTPKIETQKRIIKTKEVVKKEFLPTPTPKTQKIQKSVEPPKKKSSIVTKVPTELPKSADEPQKEPQSKPSLFDKLSQKVAPDTAESSSSNRYSKITHSIKELYGDKFTTLTLYEQKFILDNQEIMRRITQRALERVGATDIPSALRINSSNLVEFYLFPNGDISDIVFLSKSGFFILDDTTKQSIEYAYSKYPRPDQKTLIRYRFNYYLRGY